MRAVLSVESAGPPEKTRIVEAAGHRPTLRLKLARQSLRVGAARGRRATLRIEPRADAGRVGRPKRRAGGPVGGGRRAGGGGRWAACGGRRAVGWWRRAAAGGGYVAPTKPSGSGRSASQASSLRAIHNCTPWTLRGIYTAVGLSTASIAPFIPVILKGRGLDPATIGVLAALAAVAATLVVPAWGHLADAIVGRARAFQIGLLIAASLAAGLMLDLPLVVVAAMVASFTVFASLFIGLADALAVVDLPAPERQYGALRAHASLSFTVGVVAVGFLYSWAGYGAAPAVFLVWACVLLLLVGRIPDRTTLRTSG
jgi:hypothetical protein